jgi:hypothetical protein
MLRVLLGAFIVAHGLLTAFIWISPPKADAPFRATHSWLLGDARPVAVVVALVAAAGFVLAGVGVIADQAWWAVSTPDSKPCRRPSRTPTPKEAPHDSLPD